MARSRVGVLEAEVLRATLALRGNAYGLSIVNFLELDARRKISIGAVYTVLERLETKGFLTSAWGEVTPERGGRRKRLYTVNATGQAALANGDDRAVSAKPEDGWAGPKPAEA